MKVDEKREGAKRGAEDPVKQMAEVYRNGETGGREGSGHRAE